MAGRKHRKRSAAPTPASDIAVASASADNPPNPAPISRRKLWLFRIGLAVFAPLAFLLLCEAALRVIGYGYPTGFLLPAVVNGRDAWVPNPRVGRRFFGADYERKPAVFAIPREKPKGAVRIFVFGESAAFGDPAPEFGLPRLLETLLHGRYPHTRFEVVNAAMTGINSHAIREIAHDCAAADGDLWVVYMGNNEVVGPFGAGTVFGPQAPSESLIRGSLAIKSTRFGQLLSAAEQALNPPPASRRQWDGLLMFVENQLREDDPRMRRVYQHFAANLNSILDDAKQAGVGVVLSTVAVNLRDCAPFASLNKPGLSPEQRTAWKAAYRRGRAEQKAGRPHEAITHFRAAAEIDDTYADLTYAMAECLLADGKPREAASLFALAREQDVLRFRCDSKLNEVTREVAAEHTNDRVRLVDAEQEFARAAGDVPDRTHFYEHVHLTFLGNYLLARTMIDDLDALLPKRVRDSEEADAAEWLTAEECAQRLGWTSWPQVLALDDILRRLSDPPFTAQANHAAQVAALQYQADRARTKIAAESARADELFAPALAAAPDDPMLHAQLCQLHSQAGDAKAAIADARRAVELLPTCVDYWLLLASALATDQQFEDAADAYREALEVDDENSFAMLNLARIEAALNRREDAMATYRRAIAADPHAGAAYFELGQLQEDKGKFSEAEENYRLALANPPLRPQELAALAFLCQQRGWWNEAAETFLAAAKGNPRDPSLRIAAAESLAAAGKHAAALEQYRQAVKIAPDMGETHLLLGVALATGAQLDEQLDEAIEQLREAVRLMPQLVEAHLNLAVALKRAGQTDEALKHFERVLKLAPNHPAALREIDALRTNPSRRDDSR